MGDDDTHPLYKVSASDDALDLAEQVAEAMAQPFDRREVAERSEVLHEVMFADLIASLGIDNSEVGFQSGIYPHARAFAGLSHGEMPHVVLDLVFDFWVFSLGHMMVIKATTALSDKQLAEIYLVIDRLFSLFIDNHRFKRLRTRFRPFLVEFHHCLNLSHALTRSMTVSVMCHELAHIHLGHLQREQSRELEFEADALGAEYFMRHVRDGGSRGPTSVYVDPKIAAAPILLLRIFDLYEAWLSKQGEGRMNTATHPSASERAERVEALIRPSLNEKAIYILDGMSAALDDLKADL